MNLSTPLLTCQLTSNGQRNFNQVNSNLKVNGAMVDVDFICPESYTSGWDFLKDIKLSLDLRRGKGTGGTSTIIQNVSLLNMLKYSDLIAGVSTEGTKWTAGKKVRISGILPIGFFAMGANDALETFLYNGSNSLPASVNVRISAIYTNTGYTVIKTYREALPTGADQPYKNVLGIFYMGKGDGVGQCSVTDQLGDQSINVSDAIAYSNATGELEFFTDIGQLYEEPYQISQNVHFTVPTTEAGASLLIVGLDFSPDLLERNDIEQSGQREALIDQIRVNDASKYEYLTYLGKN